MNEVMTEKQAAEFLQINVETLKKKRKAGEAPKHSKALGSRGIRYLKSDLIAFLQEKTND